MSENIGKLSAPNGTGANIYTDGGAIHIDNGNLRINISNLAIDESVSETTWFSNRIDFADKNGMPFAFIQPRKTTISNQLKLQIHDSEVGDYTKNKASLTLDTSGKLFFNDCIVPYIIDSYISEDGNSWYRKYSDGWIEQGGYFAGNNTLGYQDITFPIAFVNKPVQVYTYGDLTDNWFTATTTQTVGMYSTAYGAIGITTTTKFRISSYNDGHWYACGY